MSRSLLLNSVGKLVLALPCLAILFVTHGSRSDFIASPTTCSSERPRRSQSVCLAAELRRAPAGRYAVTNVSVLPRGRRSRHEKDDLNLCYHHFGASAENVVPSLTGQSDHRRRVSTHHELVQGCQRECTSHNFGLQLFSLFKLWSCAFRDFDSIYVLDEVCYSNVTFNWSSVITLDVRAALLEVVYKYRRRGPYPVLPGALCFVSAAELPGISKIGAATKSHSSYLARRHLLQPNACSDADIDSAYDLPDWRLSRTFLDFRPEYYAAAKAYVDFYFPNGKPFIAVHILRGQVFRRQCLDILRDHGKNIFREEIPFRDNRVRSLGSTVLMSSCYPTLVEMEFQISRLRIETEVSDVLIVTNEDYDFGDGEKWLEAHVFRPLSLTKDSPVDDLIVGMLVASMGSHFVFNKFSGLSAVMYEVARSHGRLRLGPQGNALTW